LVERPPLMEVCNMCDYIQPATETVKEPPTILFELIGVTKCYRVKGRQPIKVLDGVSLAIEKGNVTGIVGPSGCGKTTLMNLLGATDYPDKGIIKYMGREMDARNSRFAELFRRNCIAWVFQRSNLIGHFDVLNNVTLPLCMKGLSFADARDKALRCLHDVGVRHVYRERVSTISGGEAQRVTIARALASGTPVILADEPSGSLDAKNTEIVMTLLNRLNTVRKVSVIIITHDISMARKHCDVIIDMQLLTSGRVSPGTAYHGVAAREYRR